MGESKIEWTDATWNPVRGCSLVSAGCTNCYAMKTAHRFSGDGRSYEGLTQLTKGGPVWTGEARFIPEKLEEPLRWRRPRKVFVNSMSDLFHEDITDEQIAAVFGVMAACPQHTFQVLTKRPERALAWFKGRFGLETAEETVAREATDRHGVVWDARGMEPHKYDRKPTGDRRPWPGWPLPNVWIGVSVEDQERADERIPLLLQIPSAVRFLSCEPLLGPVDLADIPADTDARCNCWAPVLEGAGNHRVGCAGLTMPPGIDLVIVGGESGHGARPMNPYWARSLRDQCVAAGVPFFFKQWGSFGPGSVIVSNGERRFLEFKSFEQWLAKGSTWINSGICVDTKGRQCLTGADMARARDEGAFPVTVLHKMGKAEAGRELDGCEWNEMPEVSA